MAYFIQAGSLTINAEHVAYIEDLGHRLDVHLNNGALLIIRDENAALLRDHFALMSARLTKKEGQ